MIIESMCRVCLVSEEEESSLKNMQITCKESDKPISIIFTRIGTVPYSSNDGLPQKICEKCLNELLACYEFQNKCIKSDTEIRKILENLTETIETVRNDQLKNDNEHETIIEIEIESAYNDEEKLENNCEVLIEPINNNEKPQIERPNPKHKRKTRYKCKICYKIFDRNYIYNRHIKSHKPGEVLDFECDICNFKFKTEKSFLKHLRENHLETKNADCYPCPYCSRKFLKNVSRAAHIKYHKLRTNKEIKSSICKSENQYNTDAKTNITSLNSNDCAKIEYIELSSLDVLYKKQNNSNKNLINDDNIDEVELRNAVHKCEVCYKIFDRKNRLQRHMIIHHFDDLHNSEIIENINNDSIDKVELPDPKNKRNLILRCEVCCKIFDRKNHLQRHMRIHNTAGRPFECVVCKWRFASQKNLKRHEIRHIAKGYCIKNIEKLWISPCPHCPRKFAKKESLASHMRVHRKNINQSERKGDESEIEVDWITLSGENSENICENLLEIINKTEEPEVERSNPGNKIKTTFKSEICKKNCNRNSTYNRHIKSHIPVEMEKNFLNHLKENHLETNNEDYYPYPRKLLETISSGVHMKYRKLQTNDDFNMITKLPYTKSENQNIAEVKTNINILESNDYTDIEYIEDTPQDTVVREENNRNKNLMEIKENINDNIDEVELPNPKNKRNAIHKCEVCNKSFDRKFPLQRHMNVHNPEGRPFECVVCKWRFASQKNLTTHEMKHTIDTYCIKNNEMVSQCPHCPRKFAKKESLASHMRVHKSNIPESEKTEKNYKCQFCCKSFNQIISLSRHLYIHDDKKDFNCNFCDKNFSLPKELIDHLKWHKNGMNGVKASKHLFQCKICTKSFKRPSNLKDHMRSHSGEKSYLCSKCGKGFSHSSSLRQHIIRHSESKPFECSQCSSRFVVMGDLKSHINRHKKLKPYACDSCGAKFTKRSTLTKHNLLHTEERPTCDMNMNFTRSSYLKQHTLIHIGEKPYLCKYCGKGFIQNNDLMKHLKIHLGEKIYKCCKCNESFKLQEELRDHLNEHYRKEKQIKDGMDAITKGTKEEETINSGKSVNEIVQLNFETKY